VNVATSVPLIAANLLGPPGVAREGIAGPPRRRGRWIANPLAMLRMSEGY
jgi:hypothetical protein